MDDLIKDVLVAVAGTTAAGIAFVAYRHPLEYGPLARRTSWALLGLAVAGFLWNTAVLAAWGAIKPALLDRQIEPVRNALESIIVPSWLAIMLGAIGTGLFALAWLPVLLRLPALEQKRQGEVDRERP